MTYRIVHFAEGMRKALRTRRKHTLKKGFAADLEMMSADVLRVVADVNQGARSVRVFKNGEVLSLRAAKHLTGRDGFVPRGRFTKPVGIQIVRGEAMSNVRSSNGDHSY